MPARPYKNTRRVMALWGTSLMVLVTGVVIINVAIASYVDQMRTNDYRAILSMASKYIDSDEFPNALNQAELALRKAPDRPEPWEMLGHIHYRLENWPKAVEAFRTAIIKGSEDAGVREIVVWALIEMGEYGEAVDFGQACVAAGIVPPALHRYLAEALFRDQRFTEAIPYLEVALKATPNDLYLLDHLRHACEATGALTKADETRQRIEDIHAQINRPLQPEFPQLRAGRYP